ncbi:Uncharacterised protein [Vibrio cholerae]|nr:Uncharacterised protein [Vibrio cholerae]
MRLTQSTRAECHFSQPRNGNASPLAGYSIR